MYVKYVDTRQRPQPNIAVYSSALNLFDLEHLNQITASIK
jgi:hypothetical protein